MKKLGFGAMRLPLLDPKDKTSIDDAQVAQMVDAFLAAGYNYFDTAYPYHDKCSEPAVYKALVARYAREEYQLADKMPTILVHKAEDYPYFFASQLERTGAGYFDYYLLHNLGKDRYAVNEKLDGFGFLRQKKAEGLVRKIGFSFHDDAATLETILTAHPEVDFVQLQINYLDWENPIIQSRACYETALRHGKPVVVMETIKGGLLANLPPEALALLQQAGMNDTPASYALRFVAGLPSVLRILSGMSSLAQVAENVATMADPAPLTTEETAVLQEVAALLQKDKGIPCTACGYCAEVCPQNIPIPQLFGLYNNYALNGNFSQMYHDRIVYQRGAATDCIHCRQCEKNCPQHIAVESYVEKIAQLEKPKA